MSEDAVGKALREAARALCGPEEPMKPVRRFVGDTSTEMTLIDSYMEDAAAAVAAFLRSPDINMELMLSGADAIAAAVTRAASEDKP